MSIVTTYLTLKIDGIHHMDRGSREHVYSMSIEHIGARRDSARRSSESDANGSVVGRNWLSKRDSVVGLKWPALKGVVCLKWL